MKMKRHKSRSTTRRIILTVVALSIAVSMSGCGLRRALDPYANEWLTEIAMRDVSCVFTGDKYWNNKIYNCTESEIKKELFWHGEYITTPHEELTNETVLTFFTNRGVDQCEVGSDAPLHVICYQLVHDWWPDLAFGYIPLSYDLREIEIKSPYKVFRVSDFMENEEDYRVRKGLRRVEYHDYLQMRKEAESRFLSKFSDRSLNFGKTLPSSLPPRGAW